MLILRLCLGLVLAAIIYCLLVIGPYWWMTGSVDWSRGWFGIGLLWTTNIAGGIWLYITNRELLQERVTSQGNSKEDKVATAFIILMMFSWFAFAPIEVHSLQLLPAPPIGVSWIAGGALYVIGVALNVWVFRINTFLASVVKIQKERHQYVIDTGPYAVIRHPMYTGIIFCFAGLGFIFGSTMLAVSALPFLVIGFLPRILIEEATLKNQLAGYDSYMKKVRWRLFPGIF